MKKVLSMSLAIIMAVTVFAVPTVSAAYADNADGENSLINNSAGGSSENVNSSVVDLNNVTAQLNSEEFEYTGKRITPVPVVKDGDNVLKEGTDFTLSYTGNVDIGTAVISIQGIGNYKGSKELTFKIVPADISKAVVTLESAYLDYNGKERIPKLTVKYNGKLLIDNTDYEIECSNNVYPGSKAVKIIGKNNFTSSVSKKYYIGYVKTFKVKSTGVKWIEFEWSKSPNVTGYEILKYNSAEKKWKVFKTIIGNKNTSYKTKNNLSAGTGAKYCIRTFVTDSIDNETHHHGTYSKTLAASTRPDKVSLKSVTTNVKLQLKVSWGKRNATGYQVYVSRKSNFSNVKKYSVKSYKTLSKTIQAGKDKQTYYIKVRAYKTYGGKTLYGSWSNVKKIKTDGTGWGTFNGRKYYYKEGKPLKGTHKINGKKYFFGKNTGVLLGESSKMWSKIKDEGSETKYLIAVSRDENKTCVYQRNNGEWVVKYYWICSTGASVSRTPTGYFSVPDKKPRREYFGNEKGYTCWYATRIYKGYFFHSVLYYPASQVNILDGRLGQNVSHGCVRLKKSNALWLYKNIKSGTKVVIY